MADWHALTTEGEVEKFDSCGDFLRALAQRSPEFQPEPQEATADAAADTVRSRAVAAGGNTTIPIPPGCTTFPAGSNIVQVVVTSLVILSQNPCAQFGPPILALWPTALGVSTICALPVAWQTTVQSALTWY